MASSPGLAKQRRELIKIWLKWRLALAGMIILIVALYGGGYVVSDMSDKAQEEKQAAVQDMLQMVLATVGKRFKTMWIKSMPPSIHEPSAPWLPLVMPRRLPGQRTSWPAR